MDNNLTLLKFWAPWCAPCLAMAPVLEEVLLDFDNITLVSKNVDLDSDAAIKYGVRSIPTIVLLKDGDEIASMVGGRTAEELKTFLTDHS